MRNPLQRCSGRHRGFFFFSSRRRHTRLQGDWSSDVCSSDLLGSEVGRVKLEDGSEVQGGKLLMRGQWNSDLTPELKVVYEEGLEANPPDEIGRASCRERV